MVRPISNKLSISTDVLAAFLNSNAADQAFRCVSGSVAVSAYELEALPVPAPKEMEPLARLVRAKATRDEIERVCVQLYHRSA